MGRSANFLKASLRSVLPGPWRVQLGKAYGNFKIQRARRAYADKRNGPEYLTLVELSRLMEQGYRPPDVVRYDPKGLKIRAAEKIRWLEKQIPFNSFKTSLELGCWDGMVGGALRDRGKVSYGIDIVRNGFDPRAITTGVNFVQGDASKLPIAEGTVDLVFSFGAFEHFKDPEVVLAESRRVLRKGGYFYFMFGPVYTSPYGLHAYRQIPIPYCHYLFAESDLKDYAVQSGLPTAWPYVNGMTVTAFRTLWAKQVSHFETIFYKEHPTGGVGAELIARYPSCFSGKVPRFEDLLVSGIELCCRKR